MKKSITNRQIFFLIFLALTSYRSIDMPIIIARSAGRSGWIPIIIVSLIFGVVITIIIKLNNMFKDKVLFDYGQEIVGKFITYIIVCYFIVYFILIGIFLDIKLVDVLTTNFLPSSPQYAILTLGIMLFGFAAYKGITNMARLFEIIGALFLLVTVGICILMLTQGMDYNILPIFNVSDTNHFLTAIKELFIPYFGIEILFVIPFTTINKKAPRVGFATLLFIGFFYILIVEGTFMILGVNNTALLNDSFIEAIKITEMPVIERTDIFYLTFGLSSLFAGMMIVFVVVVEFACKLFKKVKRHVVVIVVAIIMYILTLLALNIKKVDEIFDSFFIYLIIISSIIIPITLLVVAKIKKRVLEKVKK